MTASRTGDLRPRQILLALGARAPRVRRSGRPQRRRRRSCRRRRHLLYIGTYDGTSRSSTRPPSRRSATSSCRPASRGRSRCRRSRRTSTCSTRRSRRSRWSTSRRARTLDTFTLSEGNKQVRIRGLQVDPLERFLILLTRSATKQIDRWEIGDIALQLYDLAQKKITRTIPWPRGEERESVNIRFSPDGKLLYFFGDDVLILETENFTEVDTWALSRPIEPGLGRVKLRAGRRLQRRPRVLHRPVHDAGPGAEPPHHGHRPRQPGRARPSTSRRSVRPRASASRMAPDRKRGYGLMQQIGRYEFWAFDLEKPEVISRTQFEGRPRMALRVSSNGKLLYVFQAGATIDVYDAASYKLLRTIEMNADQTTNCSSCPVPPPPAPAEGVVTSQPAADANLRRAFAYLVPYWRRLVLVLVISLVSTAVARRCRTSRRTSSTARSSAVTSTRSAASCCCSPLLGVARLRPERRQRPALHARVGGDPVRHAAGAVPAPAAAVAALLRPHPAGRHRRRGSTTTSARSSASPPRPRWRGSATCCSSSAAS